MLLARARPGTAFVFLRSRNKPRQPVCASALIDPRRMRRPAELPSDGRSRADEFIPTSVLAIARRWLGMAPVRAHKTPVKSGMLGIWNLPYYAEKEEEARDDMVSHASRPVRTRPFSKGSGLCQGSEARERSGHQLGRNLTPNMTLGLSRIRCRHLRVSRRRVP